jgi:iron complex outermembrane receptor protein
MRLAPLALALCALSPANGHASEKLDPIGMTLEELVAVRILSTPKFAEDAEHSPSVISIVTAADIRTFGWRTLADVLRSLQGFTVTDDHTYSYAGVRGVSAPGDYRQRFQVLIDGMSVNENVFASVPVDSAFPLDLDLVERIEVIRGPSASVYGGDSMFGVVNVITRSGSSIGNGNGEASLGLGSGRSRQGRASLGGETATGIEYLVSVSGNQAEGQHLRFPEMAAAGQYPVASQVRGETGGRLFAQLRASDWRATFVHSDRDRVVPTGSYGTDFNDSAHRERDSFTLAEFATEQSLNPSTTLYQRIYAGEYIYRGKFPYTYPPYLINRDEVRGDWWGAEGRVVSRAWAGQRWTVGMEYKDNYRQRQLNADVGVGCFGVGPERCLDSNSGSRLFNIYAQDEIALTQQTLLTVGLRYDRNAATSNRLSPRFGLVHETARSGIFKLLYASAFRDPTVYERFYTTPTYSYGNPDIRSEQMQSVESSWEKRIGNGRFSTTLYLFRIHRLIAPDASGIVQNSAPLAGRGIEMEYEQRWLDRVSLRTGYTLQESKIDGVQMDNAPRHMFKANLGIELGHGFVAGLEGQHVTHRLTALGARTVDAYSIVNLNLRYLPPSRGWEMALGLYNLFDTRFSDPAASDMTIAGPRSSLPQMGRTAMLKGTLYF